ncbi:MAG: phosphatase PAP2 family protein [Minisyncoccia bacterium]
MDLTVFNFLHSLTSYSAILNLMFIFFAKYLPVLMGLFLIYFILREKNLLFKIFKFLFFSLTSIISYGIFTQTIRFFYHHPRPFVVLNFQPLIIDKTFSFPSGHAVLFISLGLVLYFFNKKAGFWFLILSLLVGINRIIVGVHWPSDIIGGIIIGTISYFISKFLLIKYQPKIN